MNTRLSRRMTLGLVLLIRLVLSLMLTRMTPQSVHATAPTAHITLS
jgi:hypothetical protein